MAGSNFPLVFGLDTFGDLAFDDEHRPLSHAETIRYVADEGVLAEEVGIDFFGIGEHHTNDFPMPAGDVVLSAIAARTKNIHLGSAVLVLSSDDPVRVFQRYSTLNALSNGRVEVILGRGSSIESFPLFGYDLADYETLFEEKTQLFAELMKGGPIDWHGTTRPALRALEIVPKLESGTFPVWIGVGGSPESVLRTARHGFGLMLAIIGGPPARFTPFSKIFREALDRFGQPPQPIGLHSPGHLADTDEQAMEELWPSYRDVMTRVGRQRGFAPPSKEQFFREAGPDGAWYVGSPDTVATKIASTMPILGANRFDLKYGMVGLSHRSVMTAIELFGTEVVPRVRDLLTASEASARATS
ncbi:MAG: luciferase [Acidimicrobiaceae bacterium]|jgi:probable LLM family oxidoreductase|nr:luciferase [Acidimicrobiaceae bacterium]